MAGMVTDTGTKNIDSISYVSPTGTYAATMNLMREGYSSVDSMLSGWFQVAHRGGSMDYSEHSKQAYTNAIKSGYGAFEVAVATSSDGVLFLMHDSSFQRTSGLNQSARATPWATVDTLNISVPNTSVSGATPRKYLTLGDYLNSYGDSRVHLIDTKYLYPEDRTKLRNTLKTRGLINRVLAKVVLGGPESYDEATKVAKEWHDDGFKVAGLMYSTNQSDFSTLVPLFDVLGMEHNADQSVWDSLKSVAGAKKIIGHIAPDTTAVMNAKIKGASGAMCSSPATTAVLTS